MAHELEIDEAGKASMFYHGARPWHGLGTQVDHLLTAEEALVAGGLDWQVEKWQSGAQRPDGSFIPAPQRFHVVRVKDERVLGSVGGDYTTIQNKEAFSFFDGVVASGDAKYETAGSLQGGKKVWLTAKIGDTMQVCGEDFDVYLLISTTHDGSRAFTAVTTYVRAVCSNTVTMGLNAAKTRWSLQHKTTLAGKEHEAREALKLTFKANDAFALEVQQLMQIEVTKDTFNAIITAEGFLPKQKRQLDKNVTSLMNIFETEPTIVDTDANGTAWGAYNALTYWLDHSLESRTPEARMIKLIDGMGPRLRNKMHSSLLLVGASK